MTTRETVEGITRLRVAEADACRLLALAWGHGGFESGLHSKGEVTLGEEGSRVRREGVSQVMAALRTSIVPRLDNTADSLAVAVRTMSNGFNKALTLLGLPQLE
jgi:hypothetical protein